MVVCAFLLRTTHDFAVYWCWSLRRTWLAYLKDAVHAFVIVWIVFAALGGILSSLNDWLHG